MKQLCILVLLSLFILSLQAQTYIIHTNVIDVINLKTDTDETVVMQKGKIMNAGKSTKQRGSNKTGKYEVDEYYKHFANNVKYCKIVPLLVLN